MTTTLPVSGLSQAFVNALNANFTAIDETLDTLTPVTSDAIIAALSYTPANRAGDVFSGRIESRAVAVWLESAPYNGYGYSGGNRIYAQHAAGGFAITGASRISDATGPTAAAAGAGLWGFNDGGSDGSWTGGLYAEGKKLPGAQNTVATHGAEVDITDVSGEPLAVLTPDDPYDQGATHGVWIASGGNVVGAGKASVALGIISNQGTYDKGIIFGKDAFGTVGDAATAVAFGRNHRMVWYDGSGNVTSKIWAEVSTAANGLNLFFDNTGLTVEDHSGTDIMVIDAATRRITGKTGNGSFQIDAAAGGYRSMRYLTSGSLRWNVGADDVAESGTNAGSNWALAAHDDSGALIGNAFYITRSSLTVAFGNHVLAAAASAVGLNGRSRMYSSADGSIEFRNAANSAYSNIRALVGRFDSYIEGTEVAEPSAPAANGFRIFSQDNGGGKTQLMVRFASGASQQIAIEP